MSTPTNKKALELLFERPLEPVFTTRDDGKAVFDLPAEYYEEKYADNKVEIQDRFGENTDIRIPLRSLRNPPNLNFTKPLPLKAQFSLFNPVHRRIAAQLLKIFMDAPDEQTFIETCAFVKDRVNAFLFQYCYSVAVQHRKDLPPVPIKPIAEVFPSNFVDPASLKDAREVGEIQKEGNRRHIDIERNFTASDREEEQRLGYFREDIGVNSHHWHWHLVYPGSGPEAVVRKDRRGELFYYMHHQIIARYNVERFCNGLEKVKHLNNLREAIPQGYFPKILSSLTNRTYPGRIANLNLQDIDRPGNNFEVADIQRWIDRVMTAIDQGYVTDSSGKNIPLDPIKGIDLLGDIVESTDLSVNPTLYGSIHNQGHNCISFAHDPDNRFLEDFGVMGDVTTAMRDPVFYRWHGYIDFIFERHKERLEPYGEADLQNEGVSVTNLVVKLKEANARSNVLLTYWEKSDVDLAAGLDFGPQGNIYARFTHLQHAPYQYEINVNNTSGAMKRGTCRIFLCPKMDERGTVLNLNEVRKLAIEMDKFYVTLQPGMNKIVQNSDASSVTIPYERSFRRLGKDYQPTEDRALSEFQFCGCGWPQHMLLPKGKAEGMTLTLFVMISDFAGDDVQQRDETVPICNDSASFCGLKDKLYPDKRSMGYPFDRRLPDNSLNEMVGTYGNMAATDVQIKFSDIEVDRKKI